MSNDGCIGSQPPNEPAILNIPERWSSHKQAIAGWVWPCLVHSDTVYRDTQAKILCMLNVFQGKREQVRQRPSQWRQWNRLVQDSETWQQAVQRNITHGVLMHRPAIPGSNSKHLHQHVQHLVREGLPRARIVKKREIDMLAQTQQSRPFIRAFRRIRQVQFHRGLGALRIVGLVLQRMPHS